MKVAFIDSVHPALENELKNNGYQCADFFHSSKEEMKTINTKKERSKAACKVLTLKSRPESLSMILSTRSLFFSLMT